MSRWRQDGLCFPLFAGDVNLRPGDEFLIRNAYQGSYLQGKNKLIYLRSQKTTRWLVCRVNSTFWKDFRGFPEFSRGASADR
jgi:hypothetical protein